MDAHQILNAVPAINDLSTIVAIGCVFPTYFVYLRPPTYRWILSLGIVSGLSTLLAVIMTTYLDTAAHQYSDALFFTFWFSPLNIVLIAILARIKWVARVRLWSTVVLVCVVIDWAGISLLVLALS